ncbi:MAG: 3-phosphoshikimate 1-carboxyvinyltransferase [Desulfobacterales bacterium]
MKIERHPLRTNVSVRVPGSKSFTHRLLIAAALADGVSIIDNPLRSEDTHHTAEALRKLGVAIEESKNSSVVHGRGGRLSACNEPIDLGNSGTSMRLLLSIGALGEGTYRFTGTPRMQERPVDALLDGLTRLGVPAVSIYGTGCPPVDVTGGSLKGGEVSLDCGMSSQYLSSLLLAGPVTENGLVIHVSRGPVSKPYIDMTLDIMAQMGIQAIASDYISFTVPGRQSYRPGRYAVEPDVSQAGYFWAAAAITGARVKVEGVSRGTRQGDIGLLEVFREMGCEIDCEPGGGISVQGGNLHGIDVDMGDLPDMVPTLAVAAAFADGVTRVRNVAHLRAKESDRLSAVAAELGRMGIRVREHADGIEIEGGRPKGAVIETHDDHRIAMSFALAGLAVDGVIIRNPAVVNKSFPAFWEVFGGLFEK